MTASSEPHGPGRAGAQGGDETPGWTGPERRQGPSDRRSGTERRDNERVEQDHHPRRNPSQSDRRRAG